MWFALANTENQILNDENDRCAIFTNEEAAWKFKIDNELDEFHVTEVCITE